MMNNQTMPPKQPNTPMTMGMNTEDSCGNCGHEDVCRYKDEMRAYVRSATENAPAFVVPTFVCVSFMSTRNVRGVAVDDRF